MLRPLLFAAASAVILAAFGGSDQILSWLKVSPANAGEFRQVILVFFIGVGLAFPMGIFPEILRGQQRIRLANHLVSGALILRLIFIVLALWLDWSFVAIMVIALVFVLAPDVLAAFLALRGMPAVRLRPGLVCREMLGETMGFSIFAYLATATNIVLGKTDQLVIGATLSVAAVAVYQVGAKVAEIFAQFTRQLQDTLSPAAAHLHAPGNREALRDLLVRSTRWSVLIATPLYLFCAFHLPELLCVLTGDRSSDPETWRVAQVLLAWFYTTLITHGVSKRIFMMSGHERRLMWLGLGEAVANLALSIGLVLAFGSVVCVAIGSLVPTLCFGWLHLWPWVAREAGLRPGELFRQTILPAWLGSVPLLVLLVVMAGLPVVPPANPWLILFAHGPAAAVVGVWGLWTWALSEPERASLRARLGGWYGRVRSRSAVSRAPVS